MSTQVRGGHRVLHRAELRFNLAPLAQAIALTLVAGAVVAPAHAQRSFGAAWFAAKGATQDMAARTGKLPNGKPVSSLTNSLAQQQKANAQLNRSINNLNLAARSIAAQQAAQAAARRAARDNDPSVPEGLAEGGLKVDTNSLTAGWRNANAPVQTQSGGRTNVAIQQTADKAILNWETFNVGKNTTVQFDQQANWAVLNKVNDPLARPSQIQGQIKADGTVMIVNRNGIVFSGTSQVDTRNLVAAAANIEDAQFRDKGLYVDASGTAPTFTEALGKVEVQAGARIATAAPKSATEGGGYVLMMGTEVHNAGEIATPNGQTTLAAGDDFYIRKGAGTAGNQRSTTRGNEVAARLKEDSAAGTVVNTGLITASTGDITLAGHDVTQGGVVIATTSVGTRGTVHLLNSASDATGRVTLGEASTTAVVLDASAATALDSQRDAALEGINGAAANLAEDEFDHLSTIFDRTDLSRIEIVSGNSVEFKSDSLTLATGGQITASAKNRTLIGDRAELDVSGAIGVSVTMESNNININVQGNEQRDSPVNRDGKNLNNLDVWIDRRTLVRVPAGTNGYETDRWYTAGGLLEVSGYLATSGHSVGEWMAQGGTVTVTGNELVTQQGSNINLSGGTLDVQSGFINQTWLKGPGGRLYEVSRAPGDVLYSGLYRGFEAEHARWGENATEYFYNPLIGPQRRFENGYTVGRDAGKLIVSTNTAVLEGNITSEVFQGDRQNQAPQADLDGYYQSQNAAARRAQLIIGQYLPRYVKETGTLAHSLSAVMDAVTLGELQDRIADGLMLDAPLPEDRIGTLFLDTAQLNSFELGAVRIAAKDTITVDDSLQVGHGGEIVLYGPRVDVNADLVAHSGSIQLGNVRYQLAANNGQFVDQTITPPPDGEAAVTLKAGAKLDVSGLWTNLLLTPGDGSALPYLDGGSVSVRSSGDITLEKGSAIDVSSGAAILGDGDQLGGQGGNVVLHASVNGGADTGTLILDGDLRGFGVDGAGKLDIESGAAVVVGGQLLETNGVLAGGEAAPVTLALAQALQLHVGDIAPVDLIYDNLAPGEILNSDVVFSDTGTGSANALDIVVQEDWDLTGTDMYVYVGSLAYRGNTGSRRVVPAGSVVTRIRSGTLPEGYVVQPNVLPEGLPIPAYTVAAGETLTRDTVIESGTLLHAGTVLGEDVAVKPLFELAADFFQRGFAEYSIAGKQGLVVAEGAQVDVGMPVYRVGMNALSLPTGSEAIDALEVWTPPIYLEDPVKGALTQRRGASLALQAGTALSAPDATETTNLTVERGAVINVDPGEQISLRSIGQLTVDGVLHAPSGRISLTAISGQGGGTSGQIRAEGHNRSIWVGEHAQLDVAARAVTARDVMSRRYGQVKSGGTIAIGGEIDHNTGKATAPDLFVVVREGALLDASGANAVLDVPGEGALSVASSGGRIAVSSNNGLYLDGTFKAEAGGLGAAGGTLELALETPLYRKTDATDIVLAPREFILHQHQGDTSLPTDALPNSAIEELQYGKAAFSVDRVEAGGFGNLSLLVNGVMSFDGDVSLGLEQSLLLYAGSFAMYGDTPRPSSVNLSASYVRMAGPTEIGTGASTGSIRPTVIGGVSDQISPASLTVHADLIDFRDSVTFGAHGIVQGNDGDIVLDRQGFDEVAFRSRGDIRFLKAARTSSATSVTTAGDLLFVASQLYPSTHANATVRAGYVGSGTYDASRRLVIEGLDSDVPAVPYSVFGKLELGAAHVEQGGVVRAPLGVISLGTEGTGAGTTESVTFAPGSLTSVSANGLTIPYGGTSDGVNYIYDGENITLTGVGGFGNGGRELVRGIDITGEKIDIQNDAVLDLSGGGELTGAGFVSGRGGSTDARYNPLVQFNADGTFSLPSLASNPVYAIVPGVQAAYAPIAAEAGAGDPSIGRQITIGAGVPGLPAGTYTLLPSTYALMPGAFRVEINGLAGRGGMVGSHALRNGSWATSGALAVANTNIRASLASQVIVTPADVLRSYSQYNETSYTNFALADAARLGVPRAMLPEDAMALRINFLPGAGTEALRFDGAARFDPAEGGYGGNAIVTAANLEDAVEIVGATAAPTSGFDGISIQADALNALDAPRLSIGAAPYVAYGQNGNFVEFGFGLRSLYLRQGALLQAPEVFLVTQTDPQASATSAGIVIEQGAGINSIGQGAPSYDSRDGFIYSPGQNGVVGVSNGWLQMLAPAAPTELRLAGKIRIGVCDLSPCLGNTELYSEGTIVAATDNTFEMSSDARYGTEALVLAVGGINIGSDTALADAASLNVLPLGLTLNQAILDRLLQGDTAYGAPALKTLVLTARDSVNFYGTTELSTIDPATGQSTLENLVLTTPAIYGFGGTSDVATIETGNFHWQGATNAPGAIVAGGAGTGQGNLNIQAEQIAFGYGPNTQPNNDDQFGRMTVGFANVNLAATDRITANHKGSLAVYQAQSAYVAGEGYQYSGGNLNISTPLMTGEAGSANRLTAGGSMVIMAPAGTQSADTLAVADALGAELVLEGQRIVLDTAVALPSGKLTVSAEDDLTLTDAAYIDMTGRTIVFDDVSKYSWGGDVVLESQAGNIRQAAGSVIDLSAQYNQAGTLTAIALDENAGVVDLQGQISGSSSGYYDAGGTLVPYRSGGVDIRAQRLGESGTLDSQFAALNQRLNEGGVFGARSFQLKQGDLTIGDGLKAREVNVSVDNGSLTVTGTVDASGEQVGSIRLAGTNGLTIAGTALLDAHGTVLRVDSYGKIIDAPNRAIVELNGGRDGRLTLANGARIDVRTGTEALIGAGPGQHDGVARGTVELNARRLGGMTGGDIDIDASGSLDIQGARSIAVNGTWRYTDTGPDADPDAIVNDGSDAVSGQPYWEITQGYLDDKHDQSTLFMNAALANGNLLNNKLAGLNNAAYADAFHLRPGIELVTDHDVVVSGDIDLSGYRYASVNPHTQKTGTYGSGEPGALAIRAGDISIHGSITDGFALPPDTSELDGNGWVLMPGIQPFGGDLVVPGLGVELADGTTFPSGTKLNYDLPIHLVNDGQVAQKFDAGTQLPVDATLSEPITLRAGAVVGAAIRDASGNVLYAAGAIVGSDTVVPAGSILGSGTRLADAAAFEPILWPKGVPLPQVLAFDVFDTGNGPVPVGVTLDGSLALQRGAFIPASTDVKLPDDAVQVSLRPQDGTAQGKNWALAPMLDKGSQSWGLRIVAGADPQGADIRATGARRGGGDLTLGDTHYGLLEKQETIVVWAPGNSQGMPAGEPMSALDQFFNCPGPDCATAGGEVTISAINAIPSVLRTGTGDLELIANGSVRMYSPYGIYTSGTQSADRGDAYQLPRGRLGSDGSVLGPDGAGYEHLVDTGSIYQAYYPEQGGNLLLRAGGDILGDSIGGRTGATRTRERGQNPTNAVGNWLWRQGTGGTTGVDDVPTAWWINFGTYAAEPFGATSEEDDSLPYLVGFVGVGTLGGGNVTLDSRGSFGALSNRGDADGSQAPRSQGLMVAIGSTGRVLENGELLLTGGGDLSVSVGSGINPAREARGYGTGNSQERHDLNGALLNLRGTVNVNAASIGGITPRYIGSGRTSGSQDPTDVRAYDPFNSSMTSATGGIVLIPGDATVNINTRGDLVVGGSADPGRVALQNSSPYRLNGIEVAGGGQTWFSFWTDHTAINLFSAGGNLTPITTATPDAQRQNPISGLNASPTDGAFVYPSSLSAVAASGNLYLGASASAGHPGADYAANPAGAYVNRYPLILAPSHNADAVLELLATDSIYAGGYMVARSGASAEALPTPVRPAFVGRSLGGAVDASNLSSEGVVPPVGIFPLFVFGANSVTADSAIYQQPARFYATQGDIVGLNSGGVYTFRAQRAGQSWYVGATPVQMKAGRDIVNSGSELGNTTNLPFILGSGSFITNLFVHSDPDDISTVSAGRDILYSSFNVAGPGTLEISAGRHIQMEDRATVTSIGPVVPGDSRPGASIVMQAGLGAAGINYTGLLAQYLNPANLAATGTPLADQAGKVVKTYESELIEWLADRYGFAGTAEEARAYLAGLKPEEQRIFARQVYFAELKEGGREYNDEDGPRFGSYLRGRNAIASMFPSADAQGQPIAYDGDITMYRDAGVHTLLGGDIQMLTPGGQQVFGIEGEAPASTAGVITQGEGNIQLYSLGSILLGQSRIMTTFGGDILAWSARGDINAGRGSKTTVVYTPPRRVYDAWGNVELSSDVPSTGAGIATLAPIPEVPAGDVDLIAPEGTIDAGEAGIRVSGNVNLAALQVVNAANIQVKGESTGIPVVAAVNVGALTNASAAASQAATAAQDTVQRERAAARQALPSIFTVRILGFGNEPVGGDDAPPPNEPSGPQSGPEATRYDKSSLVQVVGEQGRLYPEQSGYLTESQRQRLRATR
ncbi:filamentous haemagglutinin family protein [Pigmentiphaga sp.]|uniref:filamentous haemagglutinin family protein n=1 Tax=Pigmentiphaga sp. TaxID=1977564 RepID=UPI0025F00258|nr:filamentous haemagglutinin family protein [Pigmentiphaga sp.]